MPKTTHEYLIDEISQITTDARHKEFLDLLQQKQYSEALLFGSKRSHPEDKALTEMLLILLRYKAPLSLDLEFKDKSFKNKDKNKSVKALQRYSTLKQSAPLTSIEYAIENRNYNLYFFLQKAGAQPREFFYSKLLVEIKIALSKIMEHSSDEYLQEQTRIETLLKELPLKKTLVTKADSAKYDKKRLLIILAIIKHLATYYKDLKDTSFVQCPLDSFEEEIFYIHKVDEIRKYGIHISELVANLSDSIRKKYDEFLKPLSWFSLEQLGGVLQKNHHGVMFNVFFEGLTFDKNNTSPSISFDTVTRFFEENQDTEELIEQCIPDLVTELPRLEAYVKAIYLNEITNPENKLKPDFKLTNTPFNFPGIRTVIYYFNEMKYLCELLNLLNYKEIDFFKINYKGQGEFSSEPARTLTGLDVTTKLGQHAFLRKLQRLGEIVNRKNVNLAELDNSIDYQSLIILRDGICHQDKGHNKFIVDKLLRQQWKLDGIFYKDLPELLSRIENLIILREKLHGIYDRNIPKHWHQVWEMGHKKNNAPLPEDNQIHTGLSTIRKLAAQFKSLPQSKNLLNPLKRVDAAIDALCNIKEFLMDVGYFVPNLPYKTMDEWDTYHRVNKGEGLVDLLITNYFLNDALEYNAGQLLQHLDTIRKYKEADFCGYLHQGYPALRTLRNYIEHGNPLIESYNDEFNKDLPSSGKRQKIIMSELIPLIFDLLPELLIIKDEIIRKQTIPVPKIGHSGANFWANKTKKVNIGKKEAVIFPPLPTPVKQSASKTIGNGAEVSSSRLFSDVVKQGAFKTVEPAEQKISTPSGNMGPC
jgi:uncharacterized protein with HEPN domain